jgi:hypothetical protein
MRLAVVRGPAGRQGLSADFPSLAVEQTAVVEVEHWLLRKLTSDQLADAAVHLMSDDRVHISAECALNELARQGLVETLNAR